jgi:hypothetical protein
MHLLLLVAALGGRAASVDADRVQMKGALMRIQAADGYTLHEIRSAAGTTVREYVSSSGDVFAVAWSGPAMPNLQLVLGEYFSAYQRELQQLRQTRHTRGPVAIDDGNLVVEASGHMRSYSGRAYVRRIMPANVTPSAIQ